MKKFLINSFGVMFLLSFVTTCQLPLFAACPIEGGETVCSLPDFREQVSPTYSPKSNISEFSDTGEARLNPIKRDDIEQEFKRFRPGETDYSYNSSCQFGVCMQNRSTPLFQQPKQ